LHLRHSTSWRLCVPAEHHISILHLISVSKSGSVKPLTMIYT
jgi:hypothetical protein